MNKTDDNKNKNDPNLQIKPPVLKKKIDSGEDIFILDVRDSKEHEPWKVSYDTAVILLGDPSSPEINISCW